MTNEELEQQNVLLRNAVFNGMASMLALRPGDGTPIDRQFGKICQEFQQTLDATSRTVPPMPMSVESLQWQLAATLKELEVVKESLRFANQWIDRNDGRSDFQNASQILTELERTRTELVEAQEHIHLAFHPELGWATDPTRHAREVGRRERLEELCVMARGMVRQAKSQAEQGSSQVIVLSQLEGLLIEALNPEVADTLVEGPPIST